MNKWGYKLMSDKASLTESLLEPKVLWGYVIIGDGNAPSFNQALKISNRKY